METGFDALGVSGLEVSTAGARASPSTSHDYVAD